MRALLLVPIALVAVPTSERAAPGPTPTLVVVELFTSEGCSSCPPAEALLRRLERDGLRTAPDVRVIGLAEHVDYWDDLGWRDRLAAPAFRERQRGYARRFGLSGVYTPQAVVDGARQVVGGNAAGLEQAIRKAAREPRGTLALRRAGERIELEGAWPGGRAVVRVALVQDGLQSVPSDGENAGRTLVHPGVVRWLAAAGEGVGSFRGAVALPTRGAGTFRVVAFAEQAGEGRIVAVGELTLAGERR